MKHITLLKGVKFLLSKSIVYLFSIVIISCVHSLSGFSQCMPVPVSPGCTPAGAIALADGANIGVGQMHVFTGTNTYGGLTLNGGTMIVCGTLTLNSLVMNSGTIIVEPGATLTIYNGGAAIPMGANSNIYNYGTMVLRVSLVMGANNIVMNCLPTSSFTVPFDQFIVQGPNSFFVNYGSMQCSFFIVNSNNSPNCVCLGNGSTIVTNTFINQYTNAFNVPVGAACVQVIQNVINSQAVTSTPSLYVCLGNSINVISGPNWGNATVTPNCPSCGVPLPIELLSFYGSGGVNHADLFWSTASEVNNCEFKVYRSTNAIDFDCIGGMAGSINSNTLLQYSMRDDGLSPNTLYYYQLEQIDCDGNFSKSDIISLKTVLGEELECTIFPSPADDVIHLFTGGEVPALVSLYTLSGQMVKTERMCSELDVSFISPGAYILEITSSSGYKLFNRVIVE